MADGPVVRKINRSGLRPGFDRNRIAVVPSPALLREYSVVDVGLPEMIVQAGQFELRREFEYAMASLMIGGAVTVAVISGFIYLVIRSHPQAVGSLLGAGILNIVSGFIRARFRV